MMVSEQVSVLTAVVIINTIVKGSMKFLGLLLIELKKFGISTEVASWIPAIAYTASSCLSTSASWLHKMSSSRLTSLLGGFLVSLAFLIAYTPQTAILFLGLGLSLGVGSSLSLLVGSLEVNRVFAGKQLGLAHGISLAGNTLGGLIIPPLLAILIQEFGFKGAVLIQSGLLLHCLPASLIFRSNKTSDSVKKASSYQLASQSEEESLAKSGGNASKVAEKTGNIFKSMRLWCSIWGMASTAIGYTNFGIYLPLHLHNSMGFSISMSAIYLMIFSLGDFVGRLAGPGLSDKLGQRWCWYCFGLNVAGLAMIIISFTADSFQMGLLCFIAGIGSGTMVGVFPALLSDELGADRLGQTYPVSLTIAGVLNLIGPPALAQVSTSLSSNHVMWILGTSLIVGSGPLIIHSLMRRPLASWSSNEQTAAA